jgi:large subunit ribosomal protein L18
VSLQRRRNQQRVRRSLRVRSKLRQVQDVPRISVFRSLKNLGAQVIDDRIGKTIASCSTLELSNLSGDKKARAKQVGKELAVRVRGLGIERVRFDRGRYLYHGRVAAFAEGLREGGLTV